MSFPRQANLYEYGIHVRLRSAGRERAGALLTHRSAWSTLR